MGKWNIIIPAIFLKKNVGVKKRKLPFQDRSEMHNAAMKKLKEQDDAMPSTSEAEPRLHRR